MSDDESLSSDFADDIGNNSGGDIGHNQLDVNENSVAEDSVAEDSVADNSVAEDSVFRDFVVTDAADGQRIDLFLTQACDGFSRTQIRAAVQDGGAAIDGRVVRPSFRLRTGQRLRFQVQSP